MQKWILFIFLGLLASCGGKKDKDKIGEAQACLDKTTISDAETCMENVSGLESTSAYNIRCSAKFIREGFLDPNKILDAFTALDSSSSSLDSFMSLITFTSKGNITEDATNAETTFDYCYKSGAKGALVLAAFGHMATALYKYLNSVNPGGCSASPSSTGYPLETCIANSVAAVADIAASPTPSSGALALQSSLGSIVIATYAVSCPTGRETNATLCTDLKAAVDAGGGSSAAVGKALLVNIVTN